MNPEYLDELVSFLKERVDDSLRSVIYYNFDAKKYEIVYGRDDVLDQYDEETIAKIVRSYEMESVGKMVEEDRYEHGDLNCIVRSFEGGIEINIVENGEGVAIGLEPGTFAAHNTFIGKCMELAGISE